MSQYSRFDMLAGSMVVGILELFISVTIGTHNDGEPLHLAIEAIGLSAEVGTVLAVLALLTMYGSVRPKRNCRHIGLAMSSLVLLAVFGLLLLHGGFGFGAGVVLVLALSALGLYAADAVIHVNEQRRLKC
jgi:hypothetical protein